MSKEIHPEFTSLQEADTRPAAHDGIQEVELNINFDEILSKIDPKLDPRSESVLRSLIIEGLTLREVAEKYGFTDAEAVRNVKVLALRTLFFQKKIDQHAYDALKGFTSSRVKWADENNI